MVQKYELPCPACKQKIEIETIQAGSILNCPGCGEAINVPKLRELRQLDLIQTPESTTKLAWGPLAGFLFSFGLLLLAIAIGSAIYVWQQRQTMASYSEAPDVETFEFDVDIQELTLDQSWRVWTELNEKNDLSKRPKPVFMRARDEVERLDKFLYIFGGLATVGLISCVFSFFSRTRL